MTAPTRKTPGKYDLVTEKRMVQLLSDWARSADTAFKVHVIEAVRQSETRLAQQLAELRQELERIESASKERVVGDIPELVADSGEDPEC